ncbi:MAG: homoserine kinase [Sphingomonadales bacterium]|nr:homoserine kinase [Sphingomonadales bacterium]
MAVHTPLSAGQIAATIESYDLGALTRAEPIETGIENSNYRLDTDRGAWVLTIFEKRVEPLDLPYFAALLRHLSGKGLAVPPPIADRQDRLIRTVAGKPAWLVPFLAGRSPLPPTSADARETGRALGALHAAAADFEATRINDLSLSGWRAMAAELGDRADHIDPGLGRLIDGELAFLDTHWPRALPHATIHADLFPDNVLMAEGAVTGLIDFYFACTDIRAYDLAVTHASWAFGDGGRDFDAGIGRALVAGYAETHPLTQAERTAMPLLCRGACLRFLLTRALDWFAEADVPRKDPIAFARRLEFYRAAPERLFAP